MAKYQIQQEETAGRLPYPFFVDENGEVVGNFLKAKYKKVVGFSKTPTPRNLQEFSSQMKHPEKNKGKYLVVADHNDDWFTLINPIYEVTKVGE
ncbi:MAG: hypothetical protein ACK5N8_02175 [Alphaproteobacteria bacterium]